MPGIAPPRMPTMTPIRMAMKDWYVYGVPKRNADRPARGNYAAAGGNINRQKWEFMMRR